MPKLSPRVFSISSDLKKVIRNIKMIVFDFDGVFTDNSVYVHEDGTETVRCCRSDGIGLRNLEALNIYSIILSTETNPVVSVRSKKLKIKCIQGCEDKEKGLQDILIKMKCNLANTAYVGNDTNDLPCLLKTALPIVVRDCHPDIVSIAAYQTQIPGGRGAVREVCDLFEYVLLAKS